MSNVNATVIYDAVSWSEEVGKLHDGRPNMLIRTAARGDDITLPKHEYDRLADPRTHAPFGAVAPAGSSLAQKLSSPISGAEDPDAVRVRLAAIQTEGPSVTPMLDPSGRHALAPSTEVSPDVARSRAAAGASSTSDAPAASIPVAVLDALDKPALAKMAKALGVEVGNKDSAADIKANLQAHVAGNLGAAGETDATFASGGSAGLHGLDRAQLDAKAEELGVKSDGLSDEDLLAKVTDAQDAANSGK